MIAILAIIGLGFLLWYLSKFFQRVGNIMDAAGNYIAERGVHSSGLPFDSALAQAKRDLAKATLVEKKHTLRGEGTDDEYLNRAKKEIDDLTS
jgi:hypothetical protein